MGQQGSIGSFPVGPGPIGSILVRQQGSIGSILVGQQRSIGSVLMGQKRSIGSILVGRQRSIGSILVLGFSPDVYPSSNWGMYLSVPTADAIVTGEGSCYNFRVRLRSLPWLADPSSQLCYTAK